MAQKDIQELAKYMEALEQDKKQYIEACDEAAKEAVEAMAEEDDAFEDEVIDKASLGFIDDADTNEADDFYSEDEVDTFEEDISDCVESDQQEIDENESIGSIEIEVFNDDGYGEHFVDELMKAIPSVNASVLRRKTSTGDIPVRITGDVSELKKAFAFWTGNRDFNTLPFEDKELFDSLLIYSDGDTIAEADYRETVAHCLDPIGVNASTANLIGKNSCALSMVQEEKAYRSAKKMIKALKENDFSDLSDKDLDTLDKIQIAIEHGDTLKDFSPNEVRLIEILANEMGYSLDDWMKLTPEQQDKAIKNYDDVYTPSKTGFAGIHTRKNANGKIEKYRKAVQLTDLDSKDGEQAVTMFNPNYTSDDSPYQHPSAYNRKRKKEAATQHQGELDKAASDAIRNSKGKDTWTTGEFGAMIQNLDAKQRKQLMNALIADIEDENSDPTKAGKEIQLIKKMFGKKLTTRDFGKAWGTSHVGFSKYAERIEGALYSVARKVTGEDSGQKALGLIARTNNQALKQKFADEFEKYMNSQPLAKFDTIDPERSARKRAAKSTKAIDAK